MNLYIALNDVYLPFKVILGSAAFLGGFWLIASGLIKLREDQIRHGHGSTDGVLKILGGSALLSVGTFLGVGLRTVYGTITTGHASLLGSSPGAVQDCMSTGYSCVAQNISNNVVPVFIDSSFGIAYITGGFIIITQLHRVASAYAQGRPDFPKGFIFKFIIGFIICNLPHLFTLLQHTIGTTNGVIGESGEAVYSSLQYASSSSSLQKYFELINYLFKIFVVFGLIAVWRGIHILKALSDGHNQQKTVSGAIVHIVAGTCLVNAKWSTCTIVATAWGASAFSSFCS